MAPHWLVQIFIHLSTLKILPSPYSKGQLKRTNTQRKLVATPIIFHRTKLRLTTTVHEFSPQNKILILTLNRPPFSYLWFSAKVTLLNLFIFRGSIKIRNFMVLRWLVQAWFLPQKLWRQPYWNGWSYGSKIVAYRTRQLQWHGIPTKFHTNLLIGSNVYGGGADTHRQGGDLISLHFCFRKETRLKINSAVFELLYAVRHVEGISVFLHLLFKRG
jgi:hypothetical protein